MCLNEVNVDLSNPVADPDRLDEPAVVLHPRIRVNVGRRLGNFILERWWWSYIFKSLALAVPAQCIKSICRADVKVEIAGDPGWSSRQCQNKGPGHDGVVSFEPVAESERIPEPWA